jgi:hypothetical protein
MSLFRRGRRNWGIRVHVTALLLAFYVCVAGLSPLLHHDVICHTQSPTHCTICLIGSAAEDTQGLQLSCGRPLVALGSISTGAEIRRDVLLAGDLSGRSPPPTA